MDQDRITQSMLSYTKNIPAMMRFSIGSVP